MKIYSLNIFFVILFLNACQQKDEIPEPYFNEFMNNTSLIQDLIDKVNSRGDTSAYIELYKW